MAITYHSGERIQGLSTDNAVTTSLSLSELLAYYNFDETSGTVLTNQAGTAGSSDSLGTSVNGTNVGTATVNQTGKIDKTYDFDGSGTGASYDHIAIPNALGTDLAGTNKLSYSLWFNTDEFTNSQGNGWDLIGTYGGTTGADYQGLSINHWYDGNWYIYAEYHGSFSGNAYGGISQANLGTTATGTWYHMVVVYDGTATGNANRLKIYLNGVQKTFDSFSGTIASTISYGDHPTYIGRPSYGSTYQKNFNGKIDEVTIWKRALTDDEVLGLYNGGEGATPNTAKSGFESKPTNVQVGSRFEETDTRKMYSYLPQSDISTDGLYTVIQFKESGTFTPTSSFDVEYLVVGGGGGGGDSFSKQAGGGGAGGYLTNFGGTALGVTSQAYSITVGEGGAGSTSTTGAGTSGSDSIFSSITSDGGGGGGMGGDGSQSVQNGLSGGSGGGGGGSGHTNNGGSGGTATSGQGYAGGAGNKSSSTGGSNVANGRAGGGGGASQVGRNGATDSTGGFGGAGLSNSITGTAYTYSAGGEGGANHNQNAHDNGLYYGDGGSGDSGNGANGIVTLRFLTSGNTYTTSLVTTHAWKEKGTT
jgi:hypothetical protein